MTKSQARNKNNDEVYAWIERVQRDPEDKEAQEKIVLKYEKLVESLAYKYSKSASVHEDLVQVGMIGLLGALNRFDMDRGKSFESFAIPTILGEIKRYIRDQTWSVHVPRRIKELGPKIKHTIDALTSENQKVPTVKEIAEEIGVTEEQVLETMEMGQGYHALSVDRKVSHNDEGSEVSLLDLIGSQDDEYSHIDRKLVLEKLLPILSEREQQIIIYTYFENMSQKETGEQLGISQMHVSRLLRQALKKLRDSVPSESLGFYVRDE